MRNSGWRQARRVASALLALALLAPVDATAVTMAELHDAAKKEGKVAVLGPPRAGLREALGDAFAKAYPGIDLELSGVPSEQVAAKLRSEAKAGIHSVDIMLGGPATGILLKPTGLVRMGWESWIIDPEARDMSQWRGGKFDWIDDDRTGLATVAIVVPAVVINTDMVKPGELTSDADLLNPKWKGKFATGNPLIPGSTGVAYRRLYELHGPEFVQKLVAQQPAVIGNIRQAVDFVAKGRYAFLFGPSNTTIDLFLRQGVKNIAAPDGRVWKDPLHLTPGFGVLFAMTHARGGEIFVRKAPASTVIDLARAMRHKYSRLGGEHPISMVGIRPGEKVHETLVNEYEMQRCTQNDQYFTIYPEYRQPPGPSPGKLGEEYTSENTERISDYEALSNLLDAIGEVESYL